MRAVDIDAAVRLARGCADELVYHAEDSTEPLTLAERRALLVIAAAVDREVMRWAGLPARSAEEQAVIYRALAVLRLAVLLLMSQLFVADSIGASAYLGIIVVTGTLTSLVIDHFGLIGFDVHRLNLARIIGGTLMAAGVLLIAIF